MLGLNQGQWLLLGGGALALIGYLAWRYGLPMLRTSGSKGLTFTQACDYAKGLETFHANAGCTEGAEAARKAGQYLFDSHHTPPAVPAATVAGGTP